MSLRKAALAAKPGAVAYGSWREHLRRCEPTFYGEVCELVRDHAAGDHELLSRFPSVTALYEMLVRDHAAKIGHPLGVTTWKHFYRQVRDGVINAKQEDAKGPRKRRAPGKR